MRHWIRFGWLTVAFAAGAPESALSVASAWEDMPRTFVILRAGPRTDLQRFAKVLESAGGHASVVWPARTAIVYADDGVLARSDVREWVAEHHRAAVDVSTVATYGREVELAARAWNIAREMKDFHFEPPPGGAAGPDAGPRPTTEGKESMPDRIAVSDNLPLGAEYYDTSEFMAGSTAVGVWLLEAAGSGYDWTAGEEAQTLAGVQASLDNWVSKGGAPTFLTFYLDVHTSVPVSGVPIENPQSWDTVWIDEVMNNEGWTGANVFDKCFAYNNAIRDTFDTNWCCSIVIVDSDPNVNQGLFSGGGYAWAYYGGPWVYMSRHSTWAFNSPSYWGVVPMHELGHIFMDTDEYDGAQQFLGYLNAPDTQSASVQCIMNRNDSTRVCQPTRDQLGWRDLDADGIIEPLDTDPTASLTPYVPDPTSNSTPTWSGSAAVVTISNLNPASYYTPHHAMSVTTINMVEGRIDGGAWTPAIPADGAFDDYTEDFSWTSPPLADGVHVAEARAHTSVGNWTVALPSDTITVSGSPVAVQNPGESTGLFALEPSVPSPIRGVGTLRFTLPAAGPARLSIHAVDGSRVRLLLDRALSAGPSSVSWDGRDDRGRHVTAGVYFGRLESGSMSRTRRLVVVH